MPEIKENKLSGYKVRASIPRYFRFAAIGVVSLTVLAVIFGFYRARSKTPFRLKGDHTQLSTDVVSEVNGYERQESDGGLTKYSIKADYAKTFSDNHQELENVDIHLYDELGNPSDSMTAQKVLYIPEDGKNFTAYMNGDVNIQTAGELKVKTNNLTYSKTKGTADADEAIEFERGNIRGRSFGATVNMGEKRLELLKDAELETFESPELMRANVRYAKLNSGSASYDQVANTVTLNSGVAINIQSHDRTTGNAQTTDINADRGIAAMMGADVKTLHLQKIEFFDNVRIVSTESGGSPTNIDSGYALYEKDADRFDLKNGAHIVTTTNDRSTDIRASEIVFDRSGSKAALTGGAVIAEGDDLVSGDSLFADLYHGNRLKDAVVRGNASLKTSTPERTTTVTAPELNAAYDEAGNIREFNAIGQSTADVLPHEGKNYSRISIAAARGIGMSYRGQGLIDNMRTDGRTTVQLNAQNGEPDAANKRVTADAVKTIFFENGKDIKHAEAVGNGELYIEPLNAAPENYRTTVNAPRFDCEFFATGSNVRQCTAGKKTRTLRTRTVEKEGRGTQVMTADQLTTVFNERSGSLERADAVGNAKFTELERNAIATQMTLTENDDIVRMRGGDPTAWDSASRARAKEIDWDTRNRHSYMRGGVSTTYYSRRQMGDATPFADPDKPVYVTSETAEFDHDAKTGLFTGNARGWQESNYVRADKLFIRDREGQMSADGSVQSALYDVKQKGSSKPASVPVFATSRSLSYDRETRVLKYRSDVDIRQGTDRMTAGSADVYLDEHNDVAKTVAETAVVMTQPGRRAAGDWMQYTADDENAVVRGNPATVNDVETGSSQGGQLSFNMRDHHSTVEGRTKQAPSARTKSVYKVKN